MTLIAALRCSDGIALAADSQETVTASDGSEYRRTVQKLSPLEFGSVSAIITGGGDAPLIEGFTAKLKRRMSAVSVKNLTEFVTEAEDELEQFYATNASVTKDPDMTMFIAASHPQSGEHEIWRSAVATLVPMGNSDLVGWDETLYYRTLPDIEPGGLPLHQGVMAAIRTITIAEETSNSVRGPIHAAVVRGNGIHVEDPAYVRLMRDHLLEYEQHVNRIFMHCVDTGMNLMKFETVLVEFCSRALFLHKSQIEAIVRQMLKTGLNSGTGDPYARIPPGLSVTLAAGDLDDVITEEQKQELLRKIREGVRSFSKDQRD